MVESSDEPSLLDRIRSIPRKAHASNNFVGADDKRPATIPLTNQSPPSDADVSAPHPSSGVHPDHLTTFTNTTSDHVANKTSSALPPAAPPTPNAESGEKSSSIEPEAEPNIIIRFYQACKEILFSSWLNILLVFVPVGIAVQAAGINKTIVFAINAIAIIPLAGLLSHATESVASDLGDTIGALMNITFGNAVELIILYVLSLRLDNPINRFTACMLYLTDSRQERAMGSPQKHSRLDCVLCYLPPLSFCLISWSMLHKLTIVMSLIQHCSYKGLCFHPAVLYRRLTFAKDEIQIVQASLLGSILANLLLILGMCFLFGGLRFREQVCDASSDSRPGLRELQIYNSTVTQMSACLLSLSVMSLLLPVSHLRLCRRLFTISLLYQ